MIESALLSTIIADAANNKFILIGNVISSTFPTPEIFLLTGPSHWLN